MKKGLMNKVKLLAVGICSFVLCQNIVSQTPRPVPTAYPSNISVNFVRTWDAMAPELDPNNLITRPTKDFKQSTQYLDGLGRPLQTVIKLGSLITGGTAVDLVSASEYDEFGKQQFNYLPFAANNTGGNTSLSDGKFKLNPFQQQATFMTSQFGNPNEQFFYSKTNFEASPLNRINDTYAPGLSWIGSESNVDPAQRRNVQFKYWTNTSIDDVKIWNVSNAGIGSWGSYAVNSANNGGVYPAGELFKSVSIDEHKKQVIEFKDKAGKVILKKVQLTATADDGTGSGYSGWLCTYYIYDDLNNLRCVIQPEGVKTILSTWTLSPILDQQCFRYEYDQRNRMIMKKVPGADEVYMVYDILDRLVMTQDANMRTGTVRWMVTKYDNLNRPTETGLWNNSTPFTTHLQSAYSSNNYPTTIGTYELLTLTHYDNYNALPAALSANYISTWNSYFSATNNSSWPYPQMPTQSNLVLGMKTWSQVKVLGTANTYLYSVIIYDDKARPVQVQSTNITGGLDVTTTQFSWAGQPLLSVQKQDKQGTNPQIHIVISEMQYDDLGRLLNVKKSVNSSFGSTVVTKPKQLILQNEYNALGQLKKKTLGNSNLESLSYEYNIRGWLLGVNRGYAKDAVSSNYFGFDLGYDKADNQIIGNQTYLTPQFNGNIEGMVWKSKGDGEKRKYDFNYDAVNRLMKADFSQYSGAVFDQSAGVNYNFKMGDGSNSELAYDANGNIKRMQQWGWKLTGSTQIDDLTYSYLDNGNRLKQVVDGNNDTNSKLGDFKYDPAGKTAIDYSYDFNGNMTADKNKKIQSIQYNHLNLPTIITFNNGDMDHNGNLVYDYITYTYDALGNKLQKIVDDAIGDVVIHKNTSYINGLVYQNDTLQFIGHEEGRIRFKPSIGSIPASFEYDYFLKDHLGNVRMVLTEEQQVDNYPATTLENAPFNGGTAINIENLFYNIDISKIVDQSIATGMPPYQNKNVVFNNNLYSNTGANSTRLYLLNATNNTVQDKNGLGIVLKVMAGDAIDIYGKSFHKKPVAGYSLPTNPLSVLDLLNLLAASPVVSPKVITGAQILGMPGFPSNVTNLLNNQPQQNTNMPRASINWVILDEQFKYVSGGFDMVKEATPYDINGSYKDHNISGISIPKNGYIYVYCSNESKYNVFFDNIQVVHTRGPILEETHYYPFGLVMSGISSSRLPNTTPNKFKFNGKEEQRKEFSDGSGLEWLDYGARMYDNQIGRYFTQDRFTESFYSLPPYNYCANNPISNIDINGDSLVDNNGIISKYVESINGRIAGINTILSDQDYDEQNYGITKKGLKELRGQLEGILSGVDALKKSDVIYEVSTDGSLTGDNGYTDINRENGNVQLKFSVGATNEVVGHELTHGVQYENNEVSFNRDPKRRGKLNDITDETKAYQNARLSQSGKGVNAAITDDWTRNQLPDYSTLPKGPININSKDGKALRVQTANEGKEGIPNSEFYKGWQKDYNKYKKL